MFKRIVVLAVVVLSLLGAALPSLLAAVTPTVTPTCSSSRLRLAWSNTTAGVDVYNMTTYKKVTYRATAGSAVMPWTGRYRVLVTEQGTGRIIRSWDTNCPAGRP